MWIFDSYFKGCVELWGRERGLVRTSVAYPPSFYMHLKDPHAHWEMIQALESRFRVEECSFNSIFGTFEGHNGLALIPFNGSDHQKLVGSETGSEHHHIYLTVLDPGA